MMPPRPRADPAYPEGKPHMTTYTFTCRRSAPGHPAGLDGALLVKDGFSWGAFLFPFLWFFANRLWLAGLAVMVGLAILFVAARPPARFRAMPARSCSSPDPDRPGGRQPEALDLSPARPRRRRRGDGQTPRRGRGEGLRALVAACRAGPTVAPARAQPRLLQRPSPQPHPVPRSRPPAAGGPARAGDRPVSGRGSARDERRHRRLRLGQPALGRQGVRARRAGRRLSRDRCGHDPIPRRCAAADRIVLPGVGAFADCRRGLDAVPGMVEALTRRCAGRGKPFLGICVGMQLMATAGLEYDDHAGPRLDPRRREGRSSRDDPALKIPHMGWNTLTDVAPTRCSTASRPGATACTPISCTPTPSRPTTRPTSSRPAILWRRVTAIVGAGQRRRHAVPPEKSQAARPRAHRQFPEVAPVILFPAIDLKDGQCVRLRARRHGPGDGVQRRPGRAGRGASSARASTGCMWSISTAPSRASR